MAVLRAVSWRAMHTGNPMRRSLGPGNANVHAVFSACPEGNRGGSPFDILAVTRDRAGGLVPLGRAISVDEDKGYGAIVASCSHMQFGIS
ncbi:hypothetical protein [Halomicronema sp. CCY15110]|uniref:hypothetical protein n=1 Tax=Halomicronema sp. CCY15110 TaxID=2767773 RepID=UPI00195232A0|nr:hypothetical protein [Halomicronema sp. CCY15110]